MDSSIIFTLSVNVNRFLDMLLPNTYFCNWHCSRRAMGTDVRKTFSAKLSVCLLPTVSSILEPHAAQLMLHNSYYTAQYYIYYKNASAKVWLFEVPNSGISYILWLFSYKFTSYQTGQQRNCDYLRFVTIFICDYSRLHCSNLFSEKPNEKYIL